MCDFSVIIPHYNDSIKLERLLLSIPQDNGFVQVIIVDDKSSEQDSLEKLKEKYPHCEFYDNNSSVKGAGVSRNIGLKKAMGQWLLFADADDFFVDRAFDILKSYKNNREDIVYFAPTSLIESSGDLSDRHLFYQQMVIDKLNVNDDRIRYNFVVPWSKMIKRSLVMKEGISFDEIIASNDINFSLKTGLAAKSVLAVNEVVYCVTRDAGTLTTTLSKETFISRYGAIREYNQLLRKHNLPQYQEPLWTYVKMASKIDVKLVLKVLVDCIASSDKVIPDSYLRYIRSPKAFLKRLKKNNINK